MTATDPQESSASAAAREVLPLRLGRRDRGIGMDPVMSSNDMRISSRLTLESGVWRCVSLRRTNQRLQGGPAYRRVRGKP